MEDGLRRDFRFGLGVLLCGVGGPTVLGFGIAASTNHDLKLWTNSLVHSRHCPDPRWNHPHLFDWSSQEVRSCSDAPCLFRSSESFSARGSSVANLEEG